MKSLFSAVLVIVVTQVHSAPQLISFSDGKLGVNFGGYHAAVGLGGILGNGANGGLFAEAGTPFGQSAKAGLGGAVNANGGTSGGLYAGATAGENINAAAGLAGNVNGGKPAGTGFASAQAGNSFSSSSLNGNVSPPHQQLEQNDKYKSVIKNTYQSVPFQLKTVDTNELTPSAQNSIDLGIKKSSEKIRDTSNIKIVRTNTENKKSSEIEEQINISQYIPQQTDIQKTAFVGGTIGATVNTGHISPSTIEKRIDIGNENYYKHMISTQTGIKSTDQITYKKDVSIGRNPSFFEDIFNIPIAALTAVRTFLTNTAGNTSISVEKSGTVHAVTDSILPKHASSSSVKSSDTQISVKTPNASQLLDDILAIPINTLGAVNKFLENNVPIRKRLPSVNQQEQFAPHVGPHARRRALRKGIIEQTSVNLSSED